MTVKYEETLLKVILLHLWKTDTNHYEKIENSQNRYYSLYGCCRIILAKPHSTIGQFMNNVLNRKIDDLLRISTVTFFTENVDLKICLHRRTKIEANANKYSWVWKEL